MTRHRATFGYDIDRIRHPHIGDMDLRPRGPSSEVLVETVKLKMSTCQLRRTVDLRTYVQRYTR